MANFWTFLDGKKTAIGAIMLWIAMFLQDEVIATWGINETWIPMTVHALNWFGNILVPLGIGHKAVKAIPDSPPPK